MPRKPPETNEHFSQSVRFTTEEAAWIKEMAKEVGSFAAVVRQSVNDLRTFYDLPPNQQKHLQQDAARLKLGRREYVRYLLALRYEAILKDELDD